MLDGDSDAGRRFDPGHLERRQFHGGPPNPEGLWPIVRRKLDQIDAVTKLDDLKVPPGNRLHALAGDLKGQYAMRVNDQYRIVFRFEGSDAFDVRCTDYH